jgi:hypothetical protein
MNQENLSAFALCDSGPSVLSRAVMLLRKLRRALPAAIAAQCLFTIRLAAQEAEPGSAGTNSSHPAATAQAGCHIELPRVNGGFIQNGGSCVLASYAIVANYFTGRPVADYFEGYCKHFGLAYTDAADAERKYADHFDAEWRKRDCRGYEVILDVHTRSKEECFVEARKKFDAQFYLDSAVHLKELETALGDKQAFLNITYEPGMGYHSITVFNDGSGLRTRDTNRKGFASIPGLSKIGKLRDSVLYVAKP